MLRIPKKIEYALMSLQVLSHNASNYYSAKQIANSIGIPQHLTAKTLQQLMKNGFLESQEGTKGGYKIKSEMISISFLDFLKMMGDYPKLIQCNEKILIDFFPRQDFVAPADNCEHIENCVIKSSMTKLQSKIEKLFNEIKLSEII